MAGPESIGHGYPEVRLKEGNVVVPTGTGKTSCISAALSAAPGKIVVAVRTVSQIDIYIDEINKIWSRTRHRPEIAYMVGKQKICPLEEEFKGESVYAGCSRLREWTKNYVASRINKDRQSIYDPAADNVPEEEPGYRTFCPYFLKSREAFELNGKVHFRRSWRAPFRPPGILPGHLPLRDHEPLRPE
jgi:DNA excision repair protein ERCC-2